MYGERHGDVEDLYYGMISPSKLIQNRLVTWRKNEGARLTYDSGYQDDRPERGINRYNRGTSWYGQNRYRRDDQYVPKARERSQEDTIRARSQEDATPRNLDRRVVEAPSSKNGNGEACGSGFRPMEKRKYDEYEKPPPSKKINLNGEPPKKVSKQQDKQDKSSNDDQSNQKKSDKSLKERQNGSKKKDKSLNDGQNSLKKNDKSLNEGQNGSRNSDKSPNDGQDSSKKNDQKSSGSSVKGKKSKQLHRESGTLKKKTDDTSIGTTKSKKNESKGKQSEKEKDVSKVKEGDVMMASKKSNTHKRVDDEPQQAQGDSLEPPDTSSTCDDILDRAERCVHQKKPVKAASISSSGSRESSSHASSVATNCSSLSTDSF